MTFEIAEATLREVVRPWMTLLTVIGERRRWSAMAAGVVPHMRISALICSGCISVLRLWFKRKRFNLNRILGSKRTKVNRHHGKESRKPFRGRHG